MLSMIRNFKEILEKARDLGKKRLAVPVPRSRRVSQVLEEAEKTGCITPVLVGEGRTDHPVTKDILDEAIAMAREGEVDLLFQGDADMKDFMDALTAKEGGMAERESLSYASLFELPSENRLIMLTDTLIQAFPNMRQKVRILENGIGLANVLGIEKPKIAALSYVESVNLNVPSSVEAAVLAKMSERNQIKGIVDGPLDIDCASSRERALRKGIDSAVAGEADIYFLPDIEASHLIAEVLIFLGRRTPAGVLMGTRIPVVLNPRFESPRSLVLDMALASIRD
jgi:phosphate butyryltransferase